MLTMRLQRIGKRGQAYFRIVVTEHTKKPQGEFLELLGSYDPHKKNLQAKKERIEHWRKQGVNMSATLHNLLINHNIISGEKKTSWKPKVKEKPTTPAQEATPPEKKEEPATQETPSEEKPAE